MPRELITVREVTTIGSKVRIDCKDKTDALEIEYRGVYRILLPGIEAVVITTRDGIISRIEDTQGCLLYSRELFE